MQQHVIHHQFLHAKQVHIYQITVASNVRQMHYHVQLTIQYLVKIVITYKIINV